MQSNGSSRSICNTEHLSPCYLIIKNNKDKNISFRLWIRIPVEQATEMQPSKTQWCNPTFWNE